ncbi:MAG: hypothetical protein K2L07_09130 [Lachnospiraceae bacterium]|nr:hypothetical protein [Lachnospiraceae bacterium]
MVEMKPLKRMMNEYKTLLEKYELDLKDFDIADYKKLIGEVKMFWYRNQGYVDYFINHITEKDKVAFLAGAVRLDTANNGHFGYVLVGKKRLIDDPLLKMSSFYRGGEDEINFEYANQYLRECIQDMLILFREYPEDFYILPIEFINVTEGDEYYSTLIDMSERIILSMFTVEYDNVQQLYGDNSSYEDIEGKLLPHIREQLFFDDLKDIKLSLRDRCQKYINANSNIMPLVKKLSEAQLFYMAVSQYFMQALSIVVTMKNYHMIPFIRNDISFQYFSMIFHSNIMNEFSEQDYMNTYIPYVIQKAFDFSDRGYKHIKEHIGNGKMINAIMNSFEKGKIPFPNEIVKCVEAYMQCND